MQTDRRADRRTSWRRVLAVLVLAATLPGAVLAGIGLRRAEATVDPVENDALAAAQVRFLRHGVATGAPQRMPTLSPRAPSSPRCSPRSPPSPPTTRRPGRTRDHWWPGSV